eukprot:1715048-Alexandrium_andersonii.AAC.1
MSASLVGSEMCIRDRPHCWLTAFWWSAVGDCAPSRDSATSVDAFLGPAPVSYTHLTLPTICSV